MLLVLTFSLLFVHQTRPALSLIEKSVKELIVERRTRYFDIFTVKMKTNSRCNGVICSSLGAIQVGTGLSYCKCECRKEPYTFLSSKQRCANSAQVQQFGGELSIHQLNASFYKLILN